MNLREYVVNHTDRNACRCGQCIDAGEDKTLTGHTTNVFYFDVCVKNDPDVETFRQLIKDHSGEFAEVNPFDGVEHSYIELGGWLGDQGLAMQFMGLGVLLGLWQVLHPTNVLKLPPDNPLAQQMAGMGMVSLISKK